MIRIVRVAVFTACASCSFLLDFPEESGAQGGDGGGSAGGGEGGTPPECGTNPDRVEVFWQGENSTQGDTDYVIVSGLAAGSDNGKPFLDVFGTSGVDVDQFVFPPSAANVMFAIQFLDGAAPSEIGSVVPCGDGLPYLVAGRASLNTDHQLFISGALPAAPAPVAYGFQGEEVTSCDAGSQTIIDSPGGETFVPLFALMDPGFSPSQADPSLGSNGVNLDTAVGQMVTAGIGVGDTDVYGGTLPEAGLQYYLVRSPEGGGGNVVNYPGIWANNEDVPNDLQGGIAIDSGAKVWATGLECDVAGACSDSGSVFVAVWPPNTDESFVLAVESAERSFGSAIRSGAGRVYVGGGYQGTLSISETDLEPAIDHDAFVAALDEDDQSVVWTYPKPGETPGFDTTGYEAVVDLAFAHDDDCGIDALYVVGCIVDPSAPFQSCDLDIGFEQSLGRHGFIAKLDAATGDELWAYELVPNEPEMNLLVPTAVTATSDGVWMAASFHGQIDLPGQPALTEAPNGVQALILYYEPE